MVSGINRGDNCGLHIIYSGTVGAAREAACKGVPSIALSLDNHSARSIEGFAQAARHGVVLIKVCVCQCDCVCVKRVGCMWAALS